MNIKEREKYESPFTKRTRVNLEEGFMKASVVDKEDPQDPENNVDAGDQGIEGNYDFTGNEWE